MVVVEAIDESAAARCVPCNATVPAWVLVATTSTMPRRSSGGCGASAMLRRREAARGARAAVPRRPRATERWPQICSDACSRDEPVQREYWHAGFRPCGLSDREVEVLRHLPTGATPPDRQTMAYRERTIKNIIHEVTRR